MSNNLKARFAQVCAEARKGPIIVPTMEEHFSGIVQLMLAMAVERRGSNHIVDADGRECLVDVYVLEDGFELMAGYPRSAMPSLGRDEDEG